jgi:hypothetical protein
MAVLLIGFLGTPECAAASPGVISMSGDFSTIYAVSSDGTVWWWGNNNPVPKQIAGLTDIKDVEMWSNNDCVALKNDGTVWTGYTDGSQPTRLSQLSDVRQISYGSLLKNDGTVWLWHPYQNIGIFDQPVQVPGLTDMVFIDNYVGVRSDGTVWEWGVTRDSYGDRSASDDLTPVQVPIDNVKLAFYVHTFGVALKNDGTVWTWGTNANGELGNGKRDDDGYHSTPIRVNGLSDVKAISSGDLYCLAEKSDGSLWGWGDNHYLQMGIVQVPFITKSVRLTMISDIDRFYTVGATNFVVKKDSSLWSWGWNSLGQVGDGTINDPRVMDMKSHSKDTPVKVLLDTGTAGNSTATPAAAPCPTPASSPTLVPTSNVSPTVTVAVSPSPTAEASSSTPVASQADGFGFIMTFASFTLALVFSTAYITLKRNKR